MSNYYLVIALVKGFLSSEQSHHITHQASLHHCETAFGEDLVKTPSLKTEMGAFMLLCRNSHFTYVKCILVSPL